MPYCPPQDGGLTREALLSWVAAVGRANLVRCAFGETHEMRNQQDMVDFLAGAWVVGRVAEREVWVRVRGVQVTHASSGTRKPCRVSKGRSEHAWAYTHGTALNERVRDVVM